MSADDRLAALVIFCVVILPLVCLEVGARIGAKRVRKAWQRAADTSKPAPYAPLDQTPPKPIPNDVHELLSDYEDAIYFAARHSFVPRGMSQGDQNSFLADQARLVADVARLKPVLLQRLGVGTIDPSDSIHAVGGPGDTNE